MTPRQFLEAVVRPDMDDCLHNPSSLRTLYHALHSLDALAARIYVGAGGAKAFNANDDSAFRRELAGQSSDFKLVRDLAKALKHIELTRHDPMVAGADRVDLQFYGALAGAPLAAGPIGGWSEATVRLNSGELCPLFPTMRRALSFLEDQLNKAAL